MLGELAIEPAPLKANVPLLIVVSPLYVLTPLNVSVPVAPEAFATVRPLPAFPEIIPPKV
jgi:hypothetical protein